MAPKGLAIHNLVVSYQFVAGGFILNVNANTAIPDSVEKIIAAIFVILFPAKKTE